MIKLEWATAELTALSNKVINKSVGLKIIIGKAIAGIKMEETTSIRAAAQIICQYVMNYLG